MAGELLVIRRERRLLIEGGRFDLAGRVRHVSVVEGDGAGYDVGSFTLGGEPKYIEVKTTRGSAETLFFVTANEVAFSEAHPDQFFLYRVYHYDHQRPKRNTPERACPCFASTPRWGRSRRSSWRWSSSDTARSPGCRSSGASRQRDRRAKGTP
jgi:Domain of unknown function (DUF3883)